MIRRSIALIGCTALLGACVPATAEDRELNNMVGFAVAKNDILKLTIEGQEVAKHEVTYPRETEYVSASSQAATLSFSNELVPSKVHFNVNIESRQEGPLSENFGVRDLAAVTIGIAVPHPRYNHVFYQAFLKIDGEQSTLTDERVGTSVLRDLESKVGINGWLDRYVGEVETFVAPTFPESAKTLPPIKVKLYWQLPRKGVPDFSEYISSTL